jgi:hypothetical protein
MYHLTVAQLDLAQYVLQCTGTRVGGGTMRYKEISKFIAGSKQQKRDAILGLCEVRDTVTNANAAFTYIFDNDSEIADLDLDDRNLYLHDDFCMYLYELFAAHEDETRDRDNAKSIRELDEAEIGCDLHSFEINVQMRHYHTLPFTRITEALAMRSRLESKGYKPQLIMTLSTGYKLTVGANV